MLWRVSWALAQISCYYYVTGWTVVQEPCLNGDISFLWESQKFDPTQNWNAWSETDWDKIWRGWLCRRDDPRCKISCKSVHGGLLGKWVKYTQNLYLHTPCSKKLVHQPHIDNLSILSGFLKFFHWHTLQKICYKTAIKQFHHTLYASLHYLVKHECYKLAFCVR